MASETLIGVVGAGIGLERWGLQGVGFSLIGSLSLPERLRGLVVRTRKSKCGQVLCS